MNLVKRFITAESGSTAIEYALIAAGIVLAEIHLRRPTLESNYFRLLEGDHR